MDKELVVLIYCLAIPVLEYGTLMGYPFCKCLWLHELEKFLKVQVFLRKDTPTELNISVSTTVDEHNRQLLGFMELAGPELYDTIGIPYGE
jgi:hypothetical protein